MIKCNPNIIMTTELTHAERAEMLLGDPERYQELAESYDDGVEFYEKIRSKVPRIVDDFQEYLSYHRIFIENGPTGYIYGMLKRNTNRSIKNMLIGGSDAGRAFRIYTLEDAAQRVTAYQELGVEKTSLHGVVTALLEELYEETNLQQFVYPILSTLLSRVPSSERSSVELVARARLVTGLTAAQSDQQMLDELTAYLDVTVDPRPEDNRTASELIDEAYRRSFDDTELVELYEAALRREPSLDILSKYLHFSGRDVVERYRHRGLTSPTVSELLLSERQFAEIQDFPVQRKNKNIAYTRSYRHLARGIYESGREWQSEQDPRRTAASDFMKAAQEYLRAAVAIKQYNGKRYVKYLNKSFRHVANATDSWRGKIELHDCAVVALLEAGREIDDEAVDTAITESKLLQEFEKEVAESYVHLEQGNPSQAHSSAMRADKNLQEIDFKQSSYFLKRALALSEGLILETEDEYEDAVSRYSDFNIDDGAITNRKNLAQIKLYLEQGELTDAMEFVTEHFGIDSLITNAVRAITGREIITQHSHGDFSDDLIVRKTKPTEHRLQSLISLYVGTDEFKSFLRSHIRLAIFEL